MVLRATQAVVDAIISHARAEAPRECCGVLLGTLEEITGVVPGRNSADDPIRRFRLNPEDHFAAIRRARQLGVEVVGFYHSHPVSAAAPSPTDREHASYANHLYGIVTLATGAPRLELFRLVDGNFVAAPFVTVA